MVGPPRHGPGPPVAKIYNEVGGCSDCWGMFRGLIRLWWVNPRPTRMIGVEDWWSEAMLWL